MRWRGGALQPISHILLLQAYKTFALHTASEQLFQGINVWSIKGQPDSLELGDANALPARLSTQFQPRSLAMENRPTGPPNNYNTISNGQRVVIQIWTSVVFQWAFSSSNVPVLTQSWCYT